MQANRLYAALVAALVPTTALATNGDQMTALSAPQAGMGGATTAFAQDALTVLVNPAGMADLGMKDVRLDFGFGLLNPPRKVNGNESDSNWYMMPTGAVAFNVNDKLFLGMGMGGVSGMGVNVPDISLLPGSQPMVTTKQVFRFSPAAAYRVNDALTLGASLNIGYQSLALSNTNFSLPQNQQFGFGATLGATYKINPKLQAGLAWTSKTDISDMEYHTTAGKVSFDMDMPSSLAFGLAFKPMPGLLVEADIKRYYFSDVMGRIPVKGPGAPYPSVLTFGWDDQTVYAVGVKKDMGPMSFRVGFNYGKSPIGPEDVNSNLGSTAVVEKHLSFGVTRKFSDKVHGNFAYTHAFHNKVNSNTTSNSIEMYQNQYNLNVTYVF
ncbi:MAG: outer membrane protein transport protein [Pseudomonadota bacterium]